MVERVVEDGVGFDVVPAHAEAQPIWWGGYVHEVCGVDEGEGEGEGAFVLRPEGGEVCNVPLFIIFSVSIHGHVYWGNATYGV